MRRSKFVAALLLLAVLVSVAVAQTRLRRQTAEIGISNTGAITIDPGTADTVAMSGTVTSAGQFKVTRDPANTTNTSASLLVNPATSASNEFLFCALDNGTSRLCVDKEGDTSVAGALAVTGAATVGGALGVTGNATVGGTLGVTGAASAASINLGGATVTDVLTGTASLDFEAWAGGDCQTLTITVTGAASGDTAASGIPNALASVADVLWSEPWVSAADTVSLRGCKLTAGASADPAAATVRATVLKL